MTRWFDHQNVNDTGRETGYCHNIADAIAIFPSQVSNSWRNFFIPPLSHSHTHKGLARWRNSRGKNIFYARHPCQMRWNLIYRAFSPLYSPLHALMPPKKIYPFRFFFFLFPVHPTCHDYSRQPFQQDPSRTESEKGILTQQTELYVLRGHSNMQKSVIALIFFLSFIFLVREITEEFQQSRVSPLVSNLSR